MDFDLRSLAKKVERGFFSNEVSFTSTNYLHFFLVIDLHLAFYFTVITYLHFS